MAPTGLVIIERRDGWTLGATVPKCDWTRLGPSDPVALAEAAASYAERWRLRHPSVLIATATESSYFARLDADAARRIRDHASLGFELERLLPLDAEEIVADCIAAERTVSESVGAVAVALDRWGPVVDALESLMLPVTHIVPASLLVLQRAVETEVIPKNSLSFWSMTALGGEPTKVELFDLDGVGRLMAWRSCGIDPRSVEREVTLQSGGMDRDDWYWVTDPAFVVESTSAESGSPRYLSVDVLQLLTQQVRALVSGRDDPWFDLRRGPLARHDPLRPYRSRLRTFAVAAAVFWATIVGVCVAKGMQYREQTSQNERLQAERFRDALPGQRIPSAILGRMRSEREKAIGQRGSGLAVELPGRATDTLVAMLAGLPEHIDMEIRELRISGNELSIELLLESQDDAGRVAAAIQNEGFSADPPATVLVGGNRVQASLRARRNASAPIGSGGNVGASR